MKQNKIAQRPIRTNTLKLLVMNGIAVARFRDMAERTRLRNEGDLQKVESHIKLWTKYGWI